MTRIAMFFLLAGAAAVLGGSSRAAESTTWVVDDEIVQCANADFHSISEAVDNDAVSDYDVIHVCPGIYTESVLVEKPLTIRGEPDAVEEVDCFDPTPSQLGDADPMQQAIVNPPEDESGFSIAFKLEENDIVVAGFVVQGASVGIDASDTRSGYRVHHNLIRLNTLFAIDFGSEGTRESRVDRNCIRENRYGLVSELDDDRAWRNTNVDEAERIRRAGIRRDLRNARIDHNSTFRNQGGLEAAGPGRHSHVTFDHNLSREDRDAILIQNSEESTIIANEATPLRFGILVGGANDDLHIAGNHLEAGQQGIAFAAPTVFIDHFTDPTEGALVADNTITGQTQDGIVAAGPPNFPIPRIFESEFSGNVTSDNGRDGIVLRGGNANNALRGNIAERNVRYGIYAQGAIDNEFEANQMFGNRSFDARDEAFESNTWIGNQCLTDFPAGMICGIG